VKNKQTRFIPGIPTEMLKINFDYLFHYSMLPRILKKQNKNKQEFFIFRNTNGDVRQASRISLDDGCVE
jgi:hypothetical protein